MIKRGVYGTQGRRPETSSQGFTLIELLVAMVISLIVMTAIYSSYHSQQRSYLVQEQVAIHRGLTVIVGEVDAHLGVRDSTFLL